ncbi:unnamed protein product [Fusarium graminearum]|nr:unnamed protein product [Fusarium graminearum]
MSALLTRDIRSPANSMPTSHWSASDFAGAVAVASPLSRSTLTRSLTTEDGGSVQHHIQTFHRFTVLQGSLRSGHYMLKLSVMYRKPRLCASRRTRPVSSRRIESNSTQSPFTVDAKLDPDSSYSTAISLMLLDIPVASPVGSMRDIDDGSLMSNLEASVDTILLAAPCTSSSSRGRQLMALACSLPSASLFFIIPISDKIQQRYQQYCFGLHLPNSLGNSARLRRDISLNSQAFCLVDSGTYVRAYGAIAVLP